MAKPVGTRCNLECEYCFYLPKRSLFASPSGRMDDRTLETFVRTYIESQPAGSSEIEFAWQGGEQHARQIRSRRRSTDSTPPQA